MHICIPNDANFAESQQAVQATYLQQGGGGWQSGGQRFLAAGAPQPEGLPLPAAARRLQAPAVAGESGVEQHLQPGTRDGWEGVQASEGFRVWQLSQGVNGTCSQARHGCQGVLG